ncbi:MAG: SRPBCC domain-containing protein [Chloroflexota bacterium]
MSALTRVELQAEVGRRREQLYTLVSTPAGLSRWLDEAEIEANVGAPVRLRLADGVAVGVVLAVSPPQHISFSWDWEAEPLGVPSVVAFDLVDHGQRTHLTLRHVGLSPGVQLQLHQALWQHWFGRLVSAAADPTSSAQDGP